MTKEQEQIIIERYSNGETAVTISKDIGISNSTISRFVKKIGISRGHQSKKILDIEKEVVKDFQENILEVIIYQDGYMINLEALL